MDMLKRENHVFKKNRLKKNVEYFLKIFSNLFMKMAGLQYMWK